MVEEVDGLEKDDDVLDIEELGDEFFATAVLNRPGENLIETLRRARGFRG